LRQGLTMEPRLALNSQSSCLSLLSAGITDVSKHACWDKRTIRISSKRKGLMGATRAVFQSQRALGLKSDIGYFFLGNFTYGDDSNTIGQLVVITIQGASVTLLSKVTTMGWGCGSSGRAPV
jgi:hypothetical protein